MSFEDRDFGGGVHLEGRGKDKLVLRLSGRGGFFVLDLERVEALERAITEIEQRARAGIQGLVVIGDDKGFIAGADVRMIESIVDRGVAAEMSRRGQRLFARFEALPCRSVAAIHGACLGGGCEFALALDRRIATSSDSTRIGLPEVQLGILPAWGGTQRLPRLIGVAKALPLMLQGKRLDARRAVKVGLVDRVVAESFLLESALDDLDRKHAPRKLRSVDRFLTWTAAGRGFVAKKARAELEKSARGYPAPPLLLDTVLHGLKDGEASGYDAEARALAELATGPVCKNLVRLFFGSEKARKLAARFDAEAPSIDRALVVGAGVMGAGIATLMASRSVRTRLVDLAPEALQRAVARVHGFVDKAIKRRILAPHEGQATLDRFEASTELCGVKGRDLVLEAVAEKLEVKRGLYRKLEASLDDDAILATNTSSIPLRDLAAELSAPERFVGVHFFNPPEKMPLVEIIRHDRVADRTLARVLALATKLGKTPVLVRDAPGFLVNRCLAPYLGQALELCARRPSSVERIDRVATDFGMPMGPLRLLDEIGIDVAESVCSVLAAAFPDRMRTPRTLGLLREQGLYGCKNGEGFYRHDGKGSTASERTRRVLGAAMDADPVLPSGDEILDRLMLALVLEAFRCLEDGIVDSEEELDLAMVFGIGFPPSLGGPLRWARSVGLATIAARARALADSDPAFRVPALLEEAAAASTSAAPKKRDDSSSKSDSNDRALSHS